MGHACGVVVAPRCFGRRWHGERVAGAVACTAEEERHNLDVDAVRGEQWPRAREVRVRKPRVRRDWAEVSECERQCERESRELGAMDVAYRSQCSRGSLHVSLPWWIELVWSGDCWVARLALGYLAPSPRHIAQLRRSNMHRPHQSSEDVGGHGRREPSVVISIARLTF